jgi:hypothetical protein
MMMSKEWCFYDRKMTLKGRKEGTVLVDEKWSEVTSLWVEILSFEFWSRFVWNEPLELRHFEGLFYSYY